MADYNDGVRGYRCGAQCKAVLKKWTESCHYKNMAKNGMKIMIGKMDTDCNRASKAEEDEEDEEGEEDEEDEEALTTKAPIKNAQCSPNCMALMKKFVATCDYQLKQGAGAKVVFRKLAKKCGGGGDEETAAPGTSTKTHAPSASTKTPMSSPPGSKTLGPVTQRPTDRPTNKPTVRPTFAPTDYNTMPPRKIGHKHTPPPRPLLTLTPVKTMPPTPVPTQRPTQQPTQPPTTQPSRKTTDDPTYIPSITPSETPSNPPTIVSTMEPTIKPTHNPTAKPTRKVPMA